MTATEQAGIGLLVCLALAALGLMWSWSRTRSEGLEPGSGADLAAKRHLDQHAADRAGRGF